MAVVAVDSTGSIAGTRGGTPLRIVVVGRLSMVVVAAAAAGMGSALAVVRAGADLDTEAVVVAAAVTWDRDAVDNRRTLLADGVGNVAEVAGGNFDRVSAAST